MNANGSIRFSVNEMRAGRQFTVSRSGSRLRPVERETCQEQVYSKLREAFMKGQFMPGDVITLRGMAYELGTSLTPVREAVRQLIAEQALEIGPSRKLSVPIATRQTLDELRRLRVVLEGMLTEQASPRIGKAALDKLEELSSDMNLALDRGDAKRYLSRNQSFHFEIYRASGSPIAVRIVESLWLRIGPSFNLLLLNGSSLPNLAAIRIGGREFLSEHHHAIVQAIRAGRHVSARKAMEADIRDGMRFLAGVL